MKKKINKVIALGICMVILFSAGVFAEEGAVIASENKEAVQSAIVQDQVTDKEPQKAEDKAEEVKEDIKQTVVEIAQEVSLEKPEEKLEEKLIEEPEKLIESEIPEVEVQEEAIEAEAAPILMRGPAGPLKALYPVRVSGTVGKGDEHESVLCGERAGITGVYGKETINRYDRDQPIKVSVYREGYMGNMLKVEIYATNGAKATAGDSYNYEIGPDGGATAWYTDYTIENIDKDASQVEFIIKGQYMYPMGGIATFLRTVTINLSDDRNAPPENVDFIYDRMLREDAYRLWGVDEKMEYRKLSDTNWTACARNEDVYIPIPANNETYLVRYQASGDLPESQSKQIILKKRASAPGVSLDAYSEKLSSLNLDMEYDINDSGTFKPVTEELISKGVSDIIDNIPAEKCYTMKIRKRAGLMPASEANEIKLCARKEYPSNITFTPNNYNFTNIPQNMQYSMDGLKWEYLPLGSKNFENYAKGDKEVAVYIRLSAKPNYYSSSVVKTYMLPKFSEMPKTLKLDYYTETITGLNPNVKYQYVTSPNATDWRYMNIYNSAIKIDFLINSYDREIYIREMKDGSTPSVPAKFIFPKRQNCPTNITFVFNDVNNFGKGVLKNVNSDIEYRAYTTTVWQTAKEGTVFEVPKIDTKYIFRIKAKDGSFASSERIVTLYKNESYPGCSYNLNTEEVGMMNKNLEWKVDKGVYQAYTGATSNMNISNIIDTIPTGKFAEIYIRKMTSESRPHSEDKIIKVYSRLAAPTTPTFDKNKNMIMGVTSRMQYRKQGETIWRGMSSDKLDLKNIIGSETNAKIEIRFMATNINSASKAKVINCY